MSDRNGEAPSGQAPLITNTQQQEEIQGLTNALKKFVDPASIGFWFQDANPFFGDATPAQLVARGESDRLWRMITILESGQPGWPGMADSAPGASSDLAETEERGIGLDEGPPIDSSHLPPEG